MDKMLEIKGLRVSFCRNGRKTEILRGVNLSIGVNESVAVVGESGSGKTMTAMSVMKLLPGGMHTDEGKILLKGIDMEKQPVSRLRMLRGKEVSMIFQEPSSYLNPLFTIGSQIYEAIKGDMGTKAAKKQKVLAMLNEVGLRSSVYYCYPHQLSGGMQQRAMIAMALINNPGLLIADEPTTALDVTTACGIMDLLQDMKARHGLSVMFITHDISMACGFADRVAVMYTGRIVESAKAEDIYSKSLHPYTGKLISCLPERYNAGEKINVIAGEVPDFRNLPKGCAFHPRCEYVRTICAEKEPGETIKGTTMVRCFRYGNTLETG